MNIAHIILLCAGFISVRVMSEEVERFLSVRDSCAVQTSKRLMFAMTTL